MSASWVRNGEIGGVAVKTEESAVRRSLANSRNRKKASVVARRKHVAARRGWSREQRADPAGSRGGLGRVWGLVPRAMGSY